MRVQNDEPTTVGDFTTEGPLPDGVCATLTILLRAASPLVVNHVTSAESPPSVSTRRARQLLSIDYSVIAHSLYHHPPSSLALVLPQVCLRDAPSTAVSFSSFYLQSAPSRPFSPFSCRRLRRPVFDSPNKPIRLTIVTNRLCSRPFPNFCDFRHLTNSSTPAICSSSLLPPRTRVLVLSRLFGHRCSSSCTFALVEFLQSQL